MADGKMILYLHNESENKCWLNLHLKGHIEGNLFNVDEKVNIKYIKDGVWPGTEDKLIITLRPDK